MSESYPRHVIVIGVKESCIIPPYVARVVPYEHP